MLGLNLRIAALLVLWGLQRFLATVLGTTTNESERPTAVSVAAGAIAAFQETAELEAAIAQVHVFVVKTGVGISAIQAGVYEDKEGKPGKLLAKGETKTIPGAKTWCVINVTTGVLTKGSKYWVAAMPIGGSMEVSGTTTEATKTFTKSSASGHAELAELTAAEWAVSTSKGPGAMFATNEPKGPGAVSAGAQVTILGERRTEGKGAASAGARLVTTGVAQLQRGAGIVSAAVSAIASGGRQTSGAGAASGGGRATTSSEAAPILLIGSQAAIVGTPATVGLEGRPRAFKFTAQQTGLVNQISFFQAASPTAGGIRAAVLADNAGLPGAVIGTEGTLSGPFTAETTLTVSEGLSAQVVKGREYWLTLLSTGGGKVNLKVTNPVNPHSPSVLGATGVSLISEETSGSWGPDESHGPMILYGLGHLTPQGPASASAGIRPSTASERTPSGTGRVSAGAETGEATGEVTGGAKAKVRIHAGAQANATGARQATGTGRVSAGAEVGTTSALGQVTTVNYRTGLPYKKPTREEGTSTGAGVSVPFMDIYPYTASTPLLSPLAVCVHGGGWRQGYPGEYEAMEGLAIELQRGKQIKGKVQPCAAVNIEYKVASHTMAGFVGSFAEAVDDVVTAVEYAISRAAEMRADPAKVFLIGASAGGHLVAAAYRVLSERGVPIKGVIMLSGLPDLHLLVEEEEQSLSTGQSGEPLYNESIEAEGGPRNLTKHTQEALQQNVEAGFISGAPASNTTPSRAYQDLYSPTRLAIPANPSATKWLVISSAIEVVSERQSQKWQEHLEAEGRWNPTRSKRVLRTASTTETHSNGLEEVATGTGKGHALAYISGPSAAANEPMWERALPFIFAVEGAGSVSAAVRTATASQRAAKGTGRVSSGAELSTISGRQITGSVSAGVSMTQTGAIARTIEVRIRSGAQVGAIGTRATGGRASVTGAVEVTVKGSARLRSPAFVSVGATLTATGERVLDEPSGTPSAGHVAVPARGRIGP